MMFTYIDWMYLSKYIGLITSVIGHNNCKIGKWLQNSTEQSNLIVTALEHRNARGLYQKEAIVRKTLNKCIESILDLARNASTFSGMKWAKIWIKNYMLNLYVVKTNTYSLEVKKPMSLDVRSKKNQNSLRKFYFPMNYELHGPLPL